MVHVSIEAEFHIEEKRNGGIETCLCLYNEQNLLGRLLYSLMKLNNMPFIDSCSMYLYRCSPYLIVW